MGDIVERLQAEHNKVVGDLLALEFISEADAAKQGTIYLAAIAEIERLRSLQAPSPQAGYDELGPSRFCVDCRQHWYGECPCTESDCPFR